MTLETSIPDVFFNFSEEACLTVQALIANDVALGLQSLGLMPMVVNFKADRTLCEPQKVRACGSFFSEEEARMLEPWARDQARFWLASLVDDCSPLTSGLTFRLTTNPVKCLAVDATFSCSPPNVTFPPCKCNHGKYTTPFFVAPSLATRQPGRVPSTSLYCFQIRVANEDYYLIEGPCRFSSTLLKAEVWADEKLRRQVRGCRLTPNGGSSRWIATSWGPTGGNQLKATNINWGLAEADGGELCFEIKDTTSLDELCLGPYPNTCYISLFDENRSCCPTYPAVGPA
ncbi:hypothetical protein Vafri_14751 [Volvox africanus]|uniref:Pherophorin domain-containing protein n=1 Tax=Volvox africanus TaxID=51714 RepID=A0A8J4BFI8_9CHLO|nr:hypothetical protein Vafri_14751 [Volvox africanus]